MSDYVGSVRLPDGWNNPNSLTCLGSIRWKRIMKQIFEKLEDIE